MRSMSRQDLTNTNFLDSDEFPANIDCDSLINGTEMNELRIFNDARNNAIYEEDINLSFFPNSQFLVPSDPIEGLQYDIQPGN